MYSKSLEKGNNKNKTHPTTPDTNNTNIKKNITINIK